MMQLRRSEKNENSTIIIYTYKKKYLPFALGEIMSCLYDLEVDNAKKKNLIDKYILKKKQFAKVLDGTEVLYVGH